MDVGGASRDAGARMTIWNCITSSSDPAPQQHFSWMNTGELKVYAGTSDEKCIDVAGGDVTGNGTSVMIWGCNGGANQKWAPGPNNDEIRVAGTGKCLAVDGGNATPGTGLIIWDCSGNSDQKWSARSNGSSSPVVDLNQTNFGETVTRDRCLTISLGRGAAYECGDLRLAHALPTVRTMNKERTPVLLYNSQHASPHPVINADVTLPGGAALPTTVNASITVNGASSPNATRSWNASDWDQAGNTRRVALDFDASGLATGAYSYAFTVTTRSGPTTVGSVTKDGMVIVVNRASSPFGAGWWLAGLEQLMNLPDGSKLWIGGDGAARVYHPKAGTSTVWMAAAVDRPDSLTWDGSTYIRWDEHRLRVVFDAAGNHIQTINRLQHVTAFGHNGPLLETIAVPTPSGSLSYTFGYLAGILTSVSSPDGRLINIGRSGSNMTVTDPDNTTVQFGYAPGSNSILSRTDRRGNQVSYSYDGAGAVNQVQASMGSAPAITTIIRAAESQATGATALVPDSVYTLVNGPRTDTTVTRVWVDKFGEPTNVIDAIGGVTSLDRDDTLFPALVTQMTNPTGFVTRATYDSHGNDSTVTQMNPLGDGRDATTRYTWNAAYDLVTGVTQPEGETVTIGYDPATGNRTFEYPGTDPAREVQYFYDPATNLLSGWLLPDVGASHTLGRDALGNIRFSRTPLGHETDFYGDAAGRDTLAISPIDTLGRHHPFTQSKLDVMGRETSSVRWSDSTTAGAASKLTTWNYFDHEGNIDSVSTLSDPRGKIGLVRHTMTYDNLNRKTSEVMLNSAGNEVLRKSFTYDASGNRTNGGRDGGNAMTVQFDALNRQLARIGDSDIARYTYDRASRLLTADNRYAQIGRSYYPGGALRTDTLRIAVTDVTVPLAERFSAHVYPDSISYDLDGRRQSLLYPDGTLVGYTYDPVFGNIERITGPGGDLFITQYDLAGRTSQRTRLAGTPDNTFESWSYDADSRLSLDQVSGYGRSNEAQRAQRIVYDARDKVLDATGESFTYSPLGPVVQSLTTGGGSEEFTVDALGNQYTHAADGLEQTYDYVAGSTKLAAVRVPNGIYTDTTQYGYDIDGNRLGEGTWHVLDNQTPGFPARCGRTATCLYTSRDYDYNAENLLERTYQKIDTTATHQPYYPYTAEEHFRYDALGRRVWARMNHSANCYLLRPRGGCVNTLTRSVWDGDQLLYETRVSGDSAGNPEAETRGGTDYGPVMYVQGPGLDSPLAVYKFGTLAVLPFENYRGVVDVVACPRMNGCGDVPVPGIESGLYARDDANVTGRTGWFGTLQSGMKTGSGLVYQRNRYVDPETGKFTQADPIGLAGGANAWGFAAGDPVNYADPFGLCPPCEGLGIVYGGVAGAGVGIAITAGCAGVTGGICAAGAPLIVGASSGLGASIGGFVGKLADVFSRDGDPVGESGGERAGKPFTPGGKEAVRGSEGAPCAYCGSTTTRKAGPTQSQGEHVVPRADGGNGSPDNGVNACRTCNLDKGRRTPGQWEPRWYDPK